MRAGVETSIFDPAGLVPDAPTWRCPDCRTLQPESTSCRACGRSAVACRTCRLFRASIVGEVGFCASDATRAPLIGDEVRACWLSLDAAPLPPDGLFDEPPPAAAPPRSAGSPAAPAHVAGPSERRARHGGGDLVEAPTVPPTGRIRSELRRRLEGDNGDDGGSDGPGSSSGSG